MKLSWPLLFPLYLSVVCGHDAHINPQDKNSDLKQRMPKDTTWEAWHMESEHGVQEYDAASFFTLHDMRAAKEWDQRDILNLYGVLRESVIGDGDGLGTHDESEGVSDRTRDFIVKSVLDLVDANRDGKISLDEWLAFKKAGGVLRDHDVGVGHHLDFEKEYEVHHWNKYHAKDDPDVKIQHAEDVEHELLHHLHEIEHDDSLDLAQGKKDLAAYKPWFKVENIPKKYRV